MSDPPATPPSLLPNAPVRRKTVGFQELPTASVSQEKSYAEAVVDGEESLEKNPQEIVTQEKEPEKDSPAVADDSKQAAGDSEEVVAREKDAPAPADDSKQAVGDSKVEEDEEDGSQSNKAKQPKIVENSPTGRYVRFNQLLGEGAFKKVYRAYDSQQGVEVAWNAIKVAGMPPSARQRVMQEMKILQTLDHTSIIKFHSSFLSKETESVVFITEMMASGTLKEFILNRPVRLRIVKRWCRHILNALTYLHENFDSPIIHRDLKCDNIFINGSSGEIKIGDLGLASASRNGAAKSVLGTPEYMAPEMFDENYDEQVDIYAFGMCVLEMVTKETPYMECSNMAQIYKKVSSGVMPDSFKRLKECQAKEFINLCIKTRNGGDDRRPSASELRKHPFLIKRENDPEDDMDCQDLLNPEVPPTVKQDSDGSLDADDDEEEGEPFELGEGERGKENGAVSHHKLDEQPVAKAPPSPKSRPQEAESSHQVQQPQPPQTPSSVQPEQLSDATARPKQPTRLSASVENVSIRADDLAPASPGRGDQVYEFASAAKSELAVSSQQVVPVALGGAGLPTAGKSVIASSSPSDGAPVTPAPSASAIPTASEIVSAPSATAPSGAIDEIETLRVRFGVGTNVEARYGGGETWFKGKIHEVNPDNTIDVRYDDHDFEENIPPSLVRILDDNGVVYNLADVLHRSAQFGELSSSKANHAEAHNDGAGEAHPHSAPSPRHHHREPDHAHHSHTHIAHLVAGMSKNTSSTGTSMISTTTSSPSSQPIYWRLTATGPDEKKKQESHVLNIQFMLRSSETKTKQTIHFELHLGKDSAAQLAQELARDVLLAKEQSDEIAEKLISFGHEYQAYKELFRQRTAAGEPIEPFKITVEQDQGGGRPASLQLSSQSDHHQAHHSHHKGESMAHSTEAESASAATSGAPFSDSPPPPPPNFVQAPGTVPSAVSTAISGDPYSEPSPAPSESSPTTPTMPASESEKIPPSGKKHGSPDEYDRLLNEEKIKLNEEKLKYEKMQAEHQKKIDEINKLKEERNRAASTSSSNSRLTGRANSVPVENERSASELQAMLASTTVPSSSMIAKSTMHREDSGVDLDLLAANANDEESKQRRRDLAERKQREEKELLRQRQLKEAKEAEEKLSTIENLVSLKKEDDPSSNKSTLKEQMSKRIVSDYTHRQQQQDTSSVISAASISSHQSYHQTPPPSGGGAL